MSADQSWRLKVKLEAARGASFNHLIGRLRGTDLLTEIERAIPGEVELTHDGKQLFAYASSEPPLTAARRAIESLLIRDDIKAVVVVSRWEEALEDWCPTEPSSPDEERRYERALRDATEVETQTLHATVGNLIRAPFQRAMLEWASKLQLECALTTHSHLFTTDIHFTVTGPGHRVSRFQEELKAAERASQTRARGQPY